MFRSMVATTDRGGAFRLTTAPAGSQTLIVTCLGKTDERVSVTVAAGKSTMVPDVKLQNYTYSESVTVSAELIRFARAPLVSIVPVLSASSGDMACATNL